MKWATEHKISTKSPLIDELEVEPFVWIWVIVVNADKEVTWDHISFSALASSYVWQHVKSEVNDPTWQRVPDRSHDETVSCDAELSTKLSSLEDFVVASHSYSFFVSVVIIIHVWLLSSCHSVGGPRELFRVTVCWTPEVKLCLQGRMNLSHSPAALKVAVPRCRTQQLRSLFFRETRLETKLLTPDSVLDLILSSERLFWLSLLPGWTI